MITATSYRRVFKGTPDQVSEVRHAIAQQVRDTPVADDVILIVSEFACNAVLHSWSQGEIFAVSCEVHPGCVLIEVADLGGEWSDAGPDDRPHGLDIVALLTTKWGIKGGVRGSCRVVWACVEFGEP